MEIDKNPIKSVLVTGASSGIGQAIALRMSEAGWRVYAGVRKTDDALRLSKMTADKIKPVFLDVTDAGSIAAARAYIEQDQSAGGGVQVWWDW